MLYFWLVEKIWDFQHYFSRSGQPHSSAESLIQEVDMPVSIDIPIASDGIAKVVDNWLSYQSTRICSDISNIW